MKSRLTRVLTYIHTRKIDRSVAHHNMRKLGFVRVNKKGYYKGCNNDSSYFSEHWKEYIN